MEGPAGASLLMGLPVEKDSAVAIAVEGDRTFHGLVETAG